MPTVFALTPDLNQSDETGQLVRLSAGLPADRFRVEVGVLGPVDAAAAEPLREAGVTVHALGLRGGIDIRGLRRLRRAVAAASPDVIHAWGPGAVRAARLVPGPRLVASAAEPEAGAIGWLTGRLLRRANRVVAATRAEGDRLHRLGVRSDRLTLIPPGVAPTPPPPDRAAFLRDLGLPPTARLVMTAGPLPPGGGDLKAAVWAFDLLRYDFRDLYLLVFGSGPGRADLEAFGRALAFDDLRVRVTAPPPDLPAMLGLAEVVWVLRGRGGVGLAAAAMAAGRPVVGWETPDLAEVVEDGVTGRLADRREKARVAAKTYGLLADPGAAAALGTAGRHRAAEHYTTARMAEQYARVYGELETTPPPGPLPPRGGGGY
ncbi:MAG: glycosyltransferase [Gemmataceae bacterium]|nr:glycosyltransferase [Gemmataceae bacterium]